MNSVKQIIDEAICCGCGACSNMCPVGAISMIETLSGYLCAGIDGNKCVNCGKCLQVCPSYGKNYSMEEVEDISGNYISCYLAYSADKKIRRQGQSGGVVTALLKMLLEEEMIDHALVTRYDPVQGKAYSYFEDNAINLEQSEGSVYIQSSPLFELKNMTERTAVVLLGCQAKAVDLLAKNNVFNGTRPIVFGLTCASEYSSNYAKKLIQMMHGKSNLVNFRFRAKNEGGWPGDIECQYDNGEKRVLSCTERIRYKKIYESYRCIHCLSKMNKDADIVFGDPWGINIENPSDGYTYVITRSTLGEKIVNKAIDNDVIVAKEINFTDIYKGQKIEEELIPRVKIAQYICNERGWMTPYPLLHNESLSTLDILQRMTYSRSQFLAKNYILYWIRCKIRTIELITYKIKKRLRKR